MRSALVGALLALICGGSSARAADVAAGKEKAELCVGCHGENGISQTENIPSLAGQPDQFIQWQLVFFRAGARKNEQMQPIVEQINNEDIRNLGAYFASLTPPKATSPTTIRIYRRRAHRPPSAGVAPHATPILSPAPRPSRGSRASARNIWSRRCTTINQACDRRRPGGDGRRRLSPQRRGNQRARALSGASVAVSNTLRSQEPATPSSHPRCFSYALRCV